MKIEKLYPECKDYLWGGDRLITEYGKQTDKMPCAESWELSLHKDGLTRLATGRTLAEMLTERDLGENIRDFPFFPVLIKFIDAKENLSVQLHPSDEYALQNEGSFGKTEMWYIVEAEEGAGIYLGFDRDVTAEECEAAIRENRLTSLLHFQPVKAGESYIIPAGTVHAIGAGCLICEIQQNSNLTYRLYDYGRGRELHIDKGMAVASLTKYESSRLGGERLMAGKYFTVQKLSVKNETLLQTDEKTFFCLTCTKGSGEIDRQRITQGDSFFVPANYGSFTLSGEMEIIMTDVRKYYIGIDLGGTFIKGGIVDDRGNILVRDKIPTEKEKGDDGVAQNIAGLCRDLLKHAGMTAEDVVGIGIGVPGMIDSRAGEVIYANNLGWADFRIAEAVEKKTGLPVKIANDANAAALGETKFGCGRMYGSTVMLTLGTGVGGGIVIDGKLFEGNRSAGAELGHAVIVAGGEPCTCGRRGCLEAYASATALIRDTKRAMCADKNSKMWEIGDLERVTGQTAFAYRDTDETAGRVVDSYIEKLGTGITNLANEFRPEAIILGGGVSEQGASLIEPLQAYVEKEIYAADKGPQVKILAAELGNTAGLLGAAALFMQENPL